MRITMIETVMLMFLFFLKLLLSAIKNTLLIANSIRCVIIILFDAEVVKSHMWTGMPNSSQSDVVPGASGQNNSTVTGTSRLGRYGIQRGGAFNNRPL